MKYIKTKFLKHMSYRIKIVFQSCFSKTANIHSMIIQKFYHGNSFVANQSCLKQVNFTFCKGLFRLSFGVNLTLEGKTWLKENPINCRSRFSICFCSCGVVYFFPKNQPLRVFGSDHLFGQVWSLLLIIG